LDIGHWKWAWGPERTSLFVFCSVPDPVLGLRELQRVCKTNGRLLLLEHMRPENPIFGLFFDLINPMVVRMMGANINRRTMENIKCAGWRIRVEEHLSLDIVRWIEAQPCERGVRSQHLKKQEIFLGSMRYFRLSLKSNWPWRCASVKEDQGSTEKKCA
jgi:ubiquinone/menaquinone biosynthesis C-methylase UbiE